MRRPSRRRTFRLALPTVAALGAGAAVALAAIPSSDGTIHACYSPTSTPPGQLRIVDAATQQCQSGEQSIVWNQQGPTGPQGPQGPQGDPGVVDSSSSTDTSSTSTDTFSTPSQAGGPSADMFLKLDGIPGESTDEKHKGEIDVSSFAFALGRGGDGTGSGGGTAVPLPTTSAGAPGSSGTTPGAGATGKAAATKTPDKVRLQTLRVDKVFDASSPQLFRAAATGRHIKSAVLTFRRSGDTDVEFLTYTLSDVQVTSYDQGGKDGDDRDLGSLEEEIGLSAAKIHVTERTVDDKGKPGPVVSATWDAPKQHTP